MVRNRVLIILALGIILILGGIGLISYGAYQDSDGAMIGGSTIIGAGVTTAILNLKKKEEQEEQTERTQTERTQGCSGGVYTQGNESPISSIHIESFMVVNGNQTLADPALDNQFNTLSSVEQSKVQDSKQQSAISTSSQTQPSLPSSVEPPLEMPQKSTEKQQLEAKEYILKEDDKNNV